MDSFGRYDEKSRALTATADKEKAFSENFNVMEQIGSTHGTPIYVLNRAKLSSNLQRYAKLTGLSRIAYPVKANPSYEVLRTIAEHDGGADCASFLEVARAMYAGIKAERIFYNTPAPEYQHIERLVKMNVNLVADSENFMAFVADLPKATSQNLKLFIRVSSEIPMDYHKKNNWQNLTSHGSPNSKFGIPGEELPSLIRKYELPVKGLHFHVGTQMDNLDTFIDALEYLHHAVDEIEQVTKNEILHINLGGGLGIDMINSGDYPKITDYVSLLKNRFRSHINYWIEPGNSLVGDAISIVSRVVEVKSIRGKKWAIVDVGTDQLLTVSLLGWQRQVRTKNGVLSASGKDSMGGPLCFSGDLLLKQTDLALVEKGDFVCIDNVGAYCFAVSSNFNGRMYHGMAVLKEDSTFSLVDRPYDDFYSSASACHIWERKVESFQSLDVTRFSKLQSEYLSDTIKHDSYRIANAKQSAIGSFQFEIIAETKVPFISMPLAVRIAGDLGIACILKRAGKEVKDVPVWGEKVFLNASQLIDSNKPFECKITLSEICFNPLNEKETGIVAFDLADGKFVGKFFYSHSGSC